MGPVKEDTTAIEAEVEVETQESEATGVEMEPVEPGEELVGDGEGEALEEGRMYSCLYMRCFVHEGEPCLDPDNEVEGQNCGDSCAHFVLFEPTDDDLPADPEPPAEKSKPDYAVIDQATGEIGQLSLEGAIWEQYKRLSVGWSLSGSDEETRDGLEGRVRGGELKMGAFVRLVVYGEVKEYAPVLKKGEAAGKLVILADHLSDIQVTGQRFGKVEAAQNVDGELKVPDEETGSESSTTDEAEESEPVHDCTTCLHIELDGSVDPCCRCVLGAEEGTEDMWEPAPEEDSDPDISPDNRAPETSETPAQSDGEMGQKEGQDNG